MYRANDMTTYSLDNMDEHYLVIIDNMVSSRATPALLHRMSEGLIERV